MTIENFSFIVYAFMKVGILDEEIFLKKTRRALLMGSHAINWPDIGLILSVVEQLKLRKTALAGSKAFVQFWSVLSECIEMLLEK